MQKGPFCTQSFDYYAIILFHNNYRLLRVQNSMGISLQKLQVMHWSLLTGPIPFLVCCVNGPSVTHKIDQSLELTVSKCLVRSRLHLVLKSVVQYCCYYWKGLEGWDQLMLSFVLNLYYCILSLLCKYIVYPMVY